MASAVMQSPNRRQGQDRRARADRAAAADLIAALDHGEIEVLYQPQYACADQRLVGAEALARWRHRKAGTIGGEALFAVARRANLVSEVSRYLAQAALTAAATWPEHLRISLNITAEDIETPDFCEHVADALRDSGVAPQRLTLEVTEQSLVADIAGAATKLDDLAGRGIRIALDDFGAGFSNFGYLKRLPLDALKLDRSMVEGIVEHTRDLAVLRAIVAMAKALGLDVVAEGIESVAQREAIEREGCTAWQGFLGAPPLSSVAFQRAAAASAD
jgi:diguanylate cyclase